PGSRSGDVNLGKPRGRRGFFRLTYPSHPRLALFAFTGRRVVVIECAIDDPVGRKERRMRPLGLTLPALLLAAAALAQSPGTPGSPAPKDAAPPVAPKMSEKNQKCLDAYLGAWQERMAKIETLETKCVLTEIEDGKKTTFTGDISFLKPNYAKLLLKPQAVPMNPKKVKHLVADGQFLWEYDYGKKIARVEQLPKDGIGDNMLMSFLYGKKADEIKKRYDLSIDVEDKEKFNEHYLHITILPKTKEDMQEFKKAELVLWVNNKDPKFTE